MFLLHKMRAATGGQSVLWGKNWWELPLGLPGLRFLLLPSVLHRWLPCDGADKKKGWRNSSFGRVHEALGSIPLQHTNCMVVYTCNPGKQRRERQMSKAILSYKTSLRLVLATWDLTSKKKAVVTRICVFISIVCMCICVTYVWGPMCHDTYVEAKGQCL